MVVVESPAINHPASFLEAQEDFTDSQLIAKSSIERCDIAALRGIALGNEQRSENRFFQPTAQIKTSRLRTERRDFLG